MADEYKNNNFDAIRTSFRGLFRLIAVLLSTALSLPASATQTTSDITGSMSASGEFVSHPVRNFALENYKSTSMYSLT